MGIYAKKKCSSQIQRLTLCATILFLCCLTCLACLPYGVGVLADAGGTVTTTVCTTVSIFVSTSTALGFGEGVLPSVQVVLDSGAPPLVLEATPLTTLGVPLTESVVDRSELLGSVLTVVGRFEIAESGVGVVPGVKNDVWLYLGVLLGV